ncbi:hypothetical protein [uncultured Draconibacterium sp.]|uniref:hypothetical protein n=1 Tax=uncultured Draconibacterium sp. TaxID=1573823 RepID=UPI003260815A
MKQYTLTILLIFTVTFAHAQWECPSKLAANLDPVFNSPVLLGSEFQLSSGVLDGNSINTAMAFAGIDYSTVKHSLYAEGGFKAWWKYDFNQEVLFDQYRFGLRELFYQYNGDLSRFTVGLQSSTLDDHYLLNERTAGINYILDLGTWKLNLYGGTVTKDFARNGIFCTTGFIYDLPTGQRQILLGNNFGDKNLAGLTLSFLPGKEKKQKTEPLESGDDEFETFDNEFETSDEFGNESDEFESTDDEFGSFSEAEPFATVKKDRVVIEDLGIAAYTEFGDWIPNTFFHSGLFATVKFPGEFYLKTEALLQLENSNKGIIYLAELEKTFRLKSGSRLALNAAYYSFSEIDENAMVLNSYSNILAGEVLRLDAINMPLYLLGAKLNFPAQKIHLKFQHVGQTSSGDLKELDFEIGKHFNRLQVNAKGGMVNGGELEEKAFLARLEARFYF